MAVAVVLRRGRKILALRRSKRRRVAKGLWEIPAGRVKSGETPELCAVREVFEETGLQIDLDPRPLCAYPAWYGRRPMMVIVYRCRDADGRIRLSKEHEAYKWCTAHEFSRLCSFAPLVEAVYHALR